MSAAITPAARIMTPRAGWLQPGDRLLDFDDVIVESTRYLDDGTLEVSYYPPLPAVAAVESRRMDPGERVRVVKPELA
jgi:hypothetical protein